MPLPLEVFPRDEGDYVAAVTDTTVSTVSADFEVTRGVYIGAAGNLQVIMADGSDVVFVGALVGTILPLRITGTRSAGTTAAAILRLY